jgi:4-amino-4-deoxy-L-arabinose transferase-like glycosyltransferase
MSAQGDAWTSAHHGPHAHLATRATSGRPASIEVKIPLASRVGILRWSGAAWGAIGATAAFIALTCWWLTQDQSIPIYDAGDHLSEALHFHQLLQSGDILGPFNFVSVYPPLGKLVGALAIFIGGVNVSSPIIGENIVFVPLLTLGCYQAGRLLFDSRAGMLAAILVLGSPLLIEQFHVFMLDAPETACVAVAMWLILASRDFSRVGMTALAGVAVGLGMLVKVQFAYFVAGLVLVALVRGGWRNWRGFAMFALIALAIATPWYIDHLSLFSEITQIAGGKPGINPDNLPPILSIKNFTWYIWSTLNWQLLAPLFMMVLGGALWMVITLARNHKGQGMRLQVLVGGFVAWLSITLTPLHDIRYDMPLMPYLAVIGTGWIVHLQPTARLVATGVVVLGVLANTLGATFGLGRQVQLALTNPLPGAAEASADRITLYTNEGFLVAGPRRDGDVLGLLRALRRNGVQFVTWSIQDSSGSDFSFEGLLPLAFIAKLSSSVTDTREFSDSAEVATLLHEPVSSRVSPCTRLSDGTSVAVARHDPSTGKLALYCPFRHPQFYR